MATKRQEKQVVRGVKSTGKVHVSPASRAAQTETLAAGKRDINIGIDDAGNVVAPEGMSPEQVAVMFPGFFGAATPGQVKEAANAPSISTAPPGRKPEANASLIDFSDRSGFEQHLVDEIGFNPFYFDPMDYVNQAMTQLPALFNYVFQGKIMWADRNKLNKKQLADWQNAVVQYRATKYKEAVGIQQKGMQIYNYGMNKFDKAKADYDKLQAKKEKPPVEKLRYNDKTGKVTYHRWNPKTQSWVDTRKTNKAPKAGMPADVKQAWDRILKLYKDYGGGENISAPSSDEEAAEYMNKIQAMIGKKTQRDPDLQKIYDRDKKIVMEYFFPGAVGTETPPPGAGSPTATGTEIGNKASGIPDWRKYRK